MIDALDVTSTNHGGLQALIAGILRGEGNVKGNVLSEGTPNTLGIRASTNGMLQFFLGFPLPIIAPVMVTQLNHKSTVEGKVEYDFNVRLNILAGTNTYTMV